MAKSTTQQVARIRTDESPLVRALGTTLVMVFLVCGIIGVLELFNGFILLLPWIRSAKVQADQGAFYQGIATVLGGVALMGIATAVNWFGSVFLDD
jgi:hypothetical protein